MPDTRIQIWLGILVSVLAVLFYITCRPHSQLICFQVQMTALLGILFTYVSALLFFDDGGDVRARASIASQPDAP